MYDFLKRILDVVFSSLVLLFLLPLFLVVAIAIKLDNDGPIFYIPVRVGKDRKPFQMYKFRSMKMFKEKGKPVHADSYWKKHPDLYEEYKKNCWKLNDDPRITKVGKLLRKASIDEMPQFFNVLRGEMSVVGPRAYVEDELKSESERYREVDQYINRLLKVKPGITGPWQVSGRNDIPWNVRAEMDADYAERRSILYDIRIILKTPLAMINRW